MEINITSFMQNEDPYEYSASRFERGDNAARDTWNNAMDQAAREQLLTTPKELDALRDHVRGFGAWDGEDIDGWSADECNALLIQLISGDMREAGMDECDLDEFDWAEYERRANEGQISGRIYRGADGQIYYYLGD